MVDRKRYHVKRSQRLAGAKHWIKTYSGQDIVRGYRKWFRVDWLTALIELRMLGIAITDEAIEAARKDQMKRAEIRAKKKAALVGKGEFEDFQTPLEAYFGFAYVAGYTSGGAPYGITYDELDPDDELIFKYSNPWDS